jgi:adenine-specific DNA-methyltransferase
MTLQNLDCNPVDRLDRTEAQRVIEQLNLDTSKTSLERNRLGQFATPNSLAIEILQYTKTLLPPDDEIHFLDPAIGTGSFYSALLQSFSTEKIKRACGYEIDRKCAEVTLKLWSNTSLQLHIQDFTQSLPPLDEKSRFNLVICNPPYVRHHHLSREQKTFLKQLGVQETGIELSGLAGLYCFFLLATHRWMTQHGYACWLIPSEFMDVNYGGKIKEYLLEQVTLLRVHRFTPEDLQFAGVLVSSSIVWIKNIKPKQDYSIQFTDGGTINDPQSSTTISSVTLKSLSKWNKTSIFSTTQKRRTASDLRLSDLFEIKRGVATGANEFFILTPDKIDQYRIPSSGQS